MAGLAIPLSIFGGGGMPGFSAPANSSLASNGAQFGAAGAGDWNVNVAGSGQSSQSATSASIHWLWIAAAAAGAYLLLKR